MPRSMVLAPNSARAASRQLPVASDGSARALDNGAATEPISELPDDYYLVHFQTLLDTVEDRYEDLLSAEEKAFSATFRRLDQPARRLYVRLVSRKGPVFRSDKLVYEEIPDLAQTWETLAGTGFLTIDSPDQLETACDLLTVPELREIAREKGLTAGSCRSKADWRLLVISGFQPEALHLALQSRFHWLYPNHQDVLRIFRLLFFGTPEPDLTTFVLNDLGKVRFEAYPLLSSHRLFMRREEIDQALKLRDLLDDLYSLLEEGTASPAGIPSEVERLTSLLPSPDDHPLHTRWRRRFFEEAGRFWERQGNPDRALELFGDPATLPARERRARILLAQGRTVDARECCESILAAPRDPEEQEVAESLLARIRDGGRRRSSVQPPVEMLQLPFPTSEPIESRVLHALSEKGRQGFYAENHFWTSLFALAFWDIIYLPIPRAFGHPFQSGPADLFSAEFRPAREELVLKRLADLTSDRSWQERMLDVYRQKRGISNALIAWDLVPLSMLEKALEFIPLKHLAAVFDRLSRNLGGFKSGFPDLFLITSEPPGYLLAEVKSPNDRLQNNQKSWMRYFARHGIPFRLIQVAYDQQPVGEGSG